MNKLIFKNLIIIDLVSFESFSTNFINGVNIITSSDNSVGKSTIIKSLYHVLGAEVRFGHRINPKNLLIILNFSYNNLDYTIMRNQSSYKIINPQKETLSFYNSKSLTQYLNTLYGFIIEIEDANKKIELAPPVFYYLPYYIDQLKGWLPEPESFDNLTQFNKPKREASLYFHFGIFGSDYITLINEKELLTTNKKETNSNIEHTHKLLKIIEEEITTFDISVNNTDELLLQKRQHLKKYEKYNYDASTIKKKLLEHKEILFQLEHTINHIDKAIKDEQSKKNLINEMDININCPQCDFEFSVSQNKLFKVNYNLEQLSAHKIEILGQRSKLINEITNIEKELYEFSLKLKEIEQIQLENAGSLDAIIKFKGLESTKNKLLSKLKEYTITLSEVEVKLKEIRSKITKMNKQKANIDEKYSYLLEKYFKLFGVTEIVITEKNRKTFNPSKSFSSDGANQIKINLSRFYSIIELINSYKNGVIFPIVIDSPKTGEQSFTNNKTTLDNLVYKILLENQTIIATIDFSLEKSRGKLRLNKNSNNFKYFKSRNIQVLRLPDREAHLLDEQDFKANESIYRSLIEIFSKTN